MIPARGLDQASLSACFSPNYSRTVFRVFLWIVKFELVNFQAVSIVNFLDIVKLGI